MARIIQASKGAPADPSRQPDPTLDPQGVGAPDNETAPTFVAKTEFDALVTRLDGISGAVGSLKDSIQKMPKIDDEPPKKPIDAPLAERVRAIEEREEKWRQKAARESIASVLVAEGQEYPIAQDQARFLQEVFGKQVQVDDGGDVFFQDGITPVRMQDHVKAYLQTQGKWMLPVKKPPSGEPARRGMRIPNVPAEKTISYNDYVTGNYDKDAMAKGKLAIAPPPDAMAAYDTPPGE